MSTRRASTNSPARQPPLRGRHFPTAHDAGFADALQEAYAGIAAGRKPQAFTVTVLSEQRMCEIGYDWFDEGEPVLLTRETLSTEEHKERFPHLRGEEWARAAKEIQAGKNWTVDKKNPNGRIFWWYAGRQPWVAAIKQASDGGREVFCVSIHKEQKRGIAALRKRRKDLQ